MKVSYKIGSMTAESYSVGEIASVKGFNATDVQFEFEVDLSDLPQLVTALSKLKGTRDPNSDRHISEK